MPIGINQLPKSPDAVNSPEHYVSGGTEPIEYIREKLRVLKLSPFSAACWMNTIKYLSRMGLKGSALEDARKAQKYLDWMIDDLGGQ
jgi:hypothetical protein